MAPSVSKCEMDERTYLHGLCQHGKAPSVMEHGIANQIDYAKFSMKHRDKHSKFTANATEQVARPVSRSEFIGNTKAMEADWKEWTNLEKKQTWRGETLTEWDKVADEARMSGEEIDFGYLFGIMVEKESEYPEGDARRYFKYRVVFQGHNVKDQNWDVALFPRPQHWKQAKSQISTHASLDTMYRHGTWNKHIFKRNLVDLPYTKCCRGSCGHRKCIQ